MRVLGLLAQCASEHEHTPGCQATVTASDAFTHAADNSSRAPRASWTQTELMLTFVSIHACAATAPGRPSSPWLARACSCRLLLSPARSQVADSSPSPHRFSAPSRCNPSTPPRRAAASACGSTSATARSWCGTARWVTHSRRRLGGFRARSGLVEAPNGATAVCLGVQFVLQGG